MTIKVIIIIFSGVVFPSILNSQAIYNVKNEIESNKSISYKDCIEQYKLLDKKYKSLRMQPFGATDVGKPLHEVVIDFDQNFDLEFTRKKGKIICFINNGIHPGEPDGIDATLWLVQDLLKNEHLKEIMQNIVLVIIPVYNIDGILQSNGKTRVGQNGPEQYGFRGNRKNLDLNRDFIKCDSKNAISFHQLFTKWDPDIFIDNHVSDGADFQYTMTLLPTQPDKLGALLGDFLRTKMLPALYNKMEKSNFPMCPYVNVWGRAPENGGLPGFLDFPRYSSGYAACFQTIGFTLETHMLKPFDQRVKSNYQFMTSLLEYCHENRTQILEIRKKEKQNIQASSTLNIAWELDAQKCDSIDFKGYKSDFNVNSLTNLEQIYYDESKPMTWKLPYFNYANATLNIEVPEYYIIPQAYTHVIDIFHANQIEMKKIQHDTIFDVEVYYIENYKTSNLVYEGHYPHFQIKIKIEKRQIKVFEGDLFVSTHQRAKKFIVQVCEPQANDSFFSWNFFDGILSRKEGFSEYIFAKKCQEILDKNPTLKAEFLKIRQENPTLKNSNYEQLNWIYEHSEFAEPFSFLYPILRIR